METHGYAALSAKGLLTPHTYELAPLGPDEVEVAVSHCGICHSDIHLIDNDWGVSAYPLVPGHEIVGTVRTKGERVTHLEVGDRVGVGWQRASCMTCEWCLRGDHPCCAKNEATCVGHPGGFAEAVHVDGRFAFPLPKGLTSEGAAPLLCGGVTVYTPLREAARPAQRVGVIGIGGLGHLAMRFAVAYGCEVTAFSTSPNKASDARRYGAHHFVLSTDREQMRKAAGSMDLLLSTVTAPLDWAAWMAVLRPRGTLWVLGASPNDVQVPPMHFIVGYKGVRGSSIGGRPAMMEMLHFAARHSIAAQVEVMPLAECNEALARVRANTARYRMVLAVGKHAPTQ